MADDYTIYRKLKRQRRWKCEVITFDHSFAVEAYKYLIELGNTSKVRVLKNGKEVKTWP